MYRILLADDEKIVVDSISMIIEKNFPGEFDICTARTGRSLIEQAAEFRPDVAIVDIQMPGINGIHAIREIVKENQNIYFIIMTAYDRFDYAKEAVNLGVLEYMNKPFNNKDIVEVLTRTIRLIDNRRRKLRESLKVREKMEAVTPIIENGFIYSMLFSGMHSTEELENYRTLLDITAEYGCMMCLVVGDEDQNGSLTNAVGSGVRLQKNYVQVRERIRKQWPDAIVGTVISNRIPVYLPMKEPRMGYEARVAIIDACNELCAGLERATESVFRIGIGSVGGMEEGMNSYEEAMRALAISDEPVCHVDDLPVQCRYDDEYPIELEKKLFASLKSGDVELCENCASDYFDWMLTTYDQKNISVRMKTLEFVLYAEHEAFLSGGMTYHFSDRAEYMPMVYGAERNSDLRPWFVERFGAACRNMNSRKQNYENSMIARGKEYIQENFSRDISLDDVSRCLNLSPYYFSKLFKSETGITFMEYLTDLRMEKARVLLQDERLSIKEICAAVGYSDPNYFSRTFKKNMRVTPTEYREAHKYE